jgi:septal ring factor EnvC (AmiA/AmiB activator)
MRAPYNYALEAREKQQAAELAELERAKDEHFARMADPLSPIRARLDQLEADNQNLRQRLAALESRPQRNPDDW